MSAKVPRPFSRSRSSSAPGLAHAPAGTDSASASASAASPDASAGSTPLPLSPVIPGIRPGRDPERSIRPGPRRTPPEVVAATQRDRLLDGLVRTVAASGYTKARISDICSAAGVTRPVFYEQFNGKEDAFLTAYRHGTSLLLRAMEEAYDAAPGWPAAVRDGLWAMLSVLASATDFATAAVVEIDGVGPAGRAERELLLRRFHRFFTHPDRPALPGGVAPDELVDAVVGGVYSAVRQRVAAGRTGDLPGLLPALGYFVMAPFLGPGRAAAECETPPRMHKCAKNLCKRTT